MTQGTDSGDFEIVRPGNEPGTPEARKHPQTTSTAAAEPRDLPPLPSGVPPDFRERLTLALKTTRPDVLAAAEQAFRGVWANADEYVRDQIGCQLPPHLQWLVSLPGLREGYENKAIAVWEIKFEPGRALVFESLRKGSGAYQVPSGEGPVTVYVRSKK